MRVSRSARLTVKARSNLYRGGEDEPRIKEIRKEMGICATLHYSESILESRVTLCGVISHAEVRQ